MSGNHGAGDRLRQAAGLILPFFSRARDFRGRPLQIRVALHAGALVLTFAALFILNRVLEEPLRPVTPAHPPGLARLWLPVLFLALYVPSWAAFWLWRLVGPNPDRLSPFPDLDEAWEEGLRALAHVGAKTHDLPIFLVLGGPAGPEDGLFLAGQLGLEVHQVPRRQDAPIHVYASRQAIYVTCPGASLLGRQAQILATGQKPGAQEDAPQDPAIDPTATMKPGQRYGTKVLSNVLTQARAGGRSLEQLTQQERDLVRLFGAMPEGTWLRHTAQVEELTARLRYLCRLLARERQPYCPLNGLLVVLPLAAGDGDEIANETMAICQRDLATVREAAQVHAPIITLIADLETAAGFGEFVEHFTREELVRRVGQRFPLAPDVDTEQVPDMLASGVQWLCHVVFPTYAHKFFRVDGGTAREFAEVSQSNAGLYLIMSDMRGRCKRLAKIISRGLFTKDYLPPLLGGCYVGATGFQPKQQAFVTGVFRRLNENEGYVSWTRSAFRQDLIYRFWTMVGYLTIAGLAVVVLGWAVFALKPPSG